jgi:hypothetical protein
VEEIREFRLQHKVVARDTAELKYYDLIYSSRYAFFIRAKQPLALAFTTMLGDMLLQAGDGHSHPNRQLPLVGRREAPKPNQAPHPVARLDEFAFEPSMFRTTYRQGREQTHRAPVENRERQNSIKANKKQTLFFALYSPGAANPQEPGRKRRALQNKP